MQTGDNAQEPRPGEKDDGTPGDETGAQSRGRSAALHHSSIKFTPRTKEDPDGPDGAEDDPRVGPPPPPN